MKFIGFKYLPDMLRGADPAGIYMSVINQPVITEHMTWSRYEIMIQTVCGEDVHYWLFNLGTEPEVVGCRTDSIRYRTHTAETALNLFWASHNVTPLNAMIAYPKDLFLLEGSNEGLLRFKAGTNSFELCGGEQCE